MITYWYCYWRTLIELRDIVGDGQIALIIVKCRAIGKYDVMTIIGMTRYIRVTWYIKHFAVDKRRHDDDDAVEQITADDHCALNNCGRQFYDIIDTDDAIVSC